MNFWIQFFRDEEAPTFMEYALLITLIALIAALGVGVFGQGVSALFDRSNSAIP